MGGPDPFPVAFLEGGDERELQKVAGQARFAPDLEIFEGVGVGGDQRESECVFVFVGIFLGDGCSDFEPGTAPGFFCAIVLCACAARKRS